MWPTPTACTPSDWLKADKLESHVVGVEVTRVGLMDKVKAQANQIAVQANASVSKLEPVNRRTDLLLRNLGLAIYAERTGRGSPNTAAEVDALVAQIQQHEAQQRIDIVQQAAQAAAQAQAAAAAVAAANQPPPPLPPGAMPGTPGYGTPGYGPPGGAPGYGPPGTPAGQPGFPGFPGTPPQPGPYPPPGQAPFPGAAGYQAPGAPGAPAPYPQAQPVPPAPASPSPVQQYVPTELNTDQEAAPPTVLAAGTPAPQDGPSHDDSGEPESDIIP